MSTNSVIVLIKKTILKKYIYTFIITKYQNKLKKSKSLNINIVNVGNI